MDVVCGVAGGLGVVLLGLSPIFIYHIAVRRRRRNKRGVWRFNFDDRGLPAWRMSGVDNAEGVVWLPEKHGEWEGLVFEPRTGTVCVAVFTADTFYRAQDAVADEMGRRGWLPAEEGRR